MRNMKRRDFIAAAASAAAAGTAALAAPRAFGQQPVAPNAKPLGANSDIRIATIGLGGQGKNHTGIFSKIPGVRYVAVCDCDTNALEFVKKEFEKKNQTVATYTDFRKMLENKEIDAVTVASPNHWHALMGIMIMQSGKDAFVEKPVSHNIFEGQRLVEAQKYYNRICQGGTQRRSDASLKAAIKALQAGELGKIKLGRAIVYRRRQPIGMVTTPQQPPASVNYDLWCGPAQMLPIMRKKFHYDWHWFWNWGNGEVGNNIIHMIDVARWAVGAETLPKRVMSIGGKFGPQDSAETPNTQMIYYEYDGIPMIAETRGLPLNSKIDTESRFMNAKENALIHCEGGYYTGGWMYDAKGKQIKQFKVDEGGSHYANFINAVRSRKQTDLNAPSIPSPAHGWTWTPRISASPARCRKQPTSS
ncbi:MAG: Gfo/Idh/MocA family oxidoreductase [Candidatus Sumerlaeota bacterium]|nr:Gfo/Idh/MocA family oxidoreductase [Candidatus Sumerlaeota bacterium]